MVGFDSIIDACAFGEQLARQDGLLCKEISPVAAPVAHDYFNRHRPYIRTREQSVVLIMAAPAAMPALADFVAFHKGDMLYRADLAAPEEKAKLPPIYELAWNHTTLRGLKADPGDHLSPDAVSRPRARQDGSSACSATRCRCISR